MATGDKMNIDVVFFDLDETLYDFETVKEAANKGVAELIQALGIANSKKFLEALKQATDNIYKRYRGKPHLFDRRIRFRETLKILGINPNKDLIELLTMKFWNYVFSNIKPYPDVIPTLSSLQNLGIRLGIISDGLIEIQEKRLRALGISQFFDILVFSEEVGCNKPSPKVFKYALKIARAKPNRCVMIGDNVKTDILGANRVGIISVWIKRGIFKNVSPSSEMEIPKFIINNLKQIFSLPIFQEKISR